MENNLDNIDDLFRSEVEPLRLEPSDKVWNSIESELGSQRYARKRKRRLGWFTASVVLLILSYTSYKYFTSGTNNNIKKAIETDVTIDNKAQQSSIQNNASQNQQTLSQNTVSNLPDESKGNNTISVNEKPTSTGHGETNDNSLNSESKATLKNEIPVHNTINVSASRSTAANNNSAATKELLHTSLNLPGKKETKSIRVTTPSNAGSDLPAAESTKYSEAKTPVVTGYKNSNTLSSTPASNKVDNSSLSVNTSSENKNLVPVEENKRGAENTKKENTASALPDRETVPEKVNNASNTSSTDITPADTKNNSSAEPAVTDFNEENPPFVLEKIRKSASPQTAPSITEPSASTLPIQSNETSEKPMSVAASEKDSSIRVFKKIISRLSASIYFSPDYVHTTLKPNSTYTGTASQNPADYANQTAAFSYSTGFNLGYDVAKKWSIRSGISFSTFSQNAVYNTIQVVSDSVYHEVQGHDEHHHGFHNEHEHNPPNQNNDHHYVIHTPCGTIDLHHEPDEFQGSGNEPQSGQSFNIKTETSETIHFIYIPLTVRYAFGQKKLSYFVEGGGAVNLVKKDVVKVKVNDATAEDNNFDGLNSSNYSLLLGVGVNYNFYKGLSTFLRPSLRYSITPINQNNPLYSYPYYLGIGAGFSIHF